MYTDRLNPVDGLPEFKNTRKVVTEREKRIAARRARRFVIIPWNVLVAVSRALRFGRALRLLFLLCLYQNLKKTAANGGWIELLQHDVDAMDLSDSNLCKATYQLETRGLIEVQRRRASGHCCDWLGEKMCRDHPTPLRHPRGRQ
jgi:hypothetical protein